MGTMRRGPGGLVLKALALTRQGSLGEATAVIQKALRLVVPAVLVPGAASRTPERAAQPVDANVRKAPPAGMRPASRIDAERPLPAPPERRSRDEPDATAEARGRTPAPHGFLAGSHAFAGTSRNYKLFVPVDLPADPSLVVMLHGCTQSPDDFAAGTRMNEWASRDGFLVLYPEQSRSANPSSCWNWFQTNDQQRDHGETGLIASLTRKVVADYDADPTRVYVAGLSAGGAMAANLAEAYPDLFAAVAIHSGLVAHAANNVVDALTAMRRGASRRPATANGLVTGFPPTPTIVFHGDDDRTVHPVNGDQIVSAAFHAQATPTPDVETGRSTEGRSYVRERFQDDDGITRVEHWKLEAAGHAWAGGDAAGTYTDPRGVDATQEMLRFFALHRLDLANRS